MGLGHCLLSLTPGNFFPVPIPTSAPSFFSQIFVLSSHLILTVQYTSQLGDLCSQVSQWEERGMWPTPTWSSSYFRMNSWNTARRFISSDLLMVKTRLQNTYLPKDWFWGCLKDSSTSKWNRQLNIFLRRKDLNWYFTKEMGIYGCP